ncbi:CYTH and CHAD domain-containing protein [Roseospira visakhapatnamensis]|uniref:Inorganic triphosphatase YgiF n=1 Tax=Roseospira visakhapatnamensis TaxID=390880 RepID=A0A7W6RBM0_9PROT|nr:CYTH and CHAD domain-containing protein [Roseospira visakhapatnamensis]MBB4265540.1 inorganic triphosphatase YgiF [Roseospira visakhapatnamensis]
MELKLVVAPAHLTKVRGLGWVRDLCHGRPARRHLVSTYFDTVDETLLRRGVALRVRRQGRARIQAIKADQQDAAGLFHRLEWESEVAGEVPDLAAARAAGLEALVEGVAVADEGADALRPVCATDVHRTEMRLMGDDWAVSMALDHGTVSAGGREAAISEIELELVRGTAGAVYALAARLAETVPVRLGRFSKAERALALARGAPPPPRPARAQDLPLSPDMPVGAAFQAIGRACLAQMAGNEAALLERHDPEAVHQMRIAVRRMRAAMTTFGAVARGPGLDGVKADLRWLMGVLGPARDIDVFLADILDPVIARSPEDPGLARLRALFSARRDARYRDALAAVGDARFTRLILGLGAWIEGGDWLDDPRRAKARAAPVAAFARATLERRRRKVRKAGRRFDGLTPEARHDLRILVKKLRYTGEFFAGVFGTKVARPVLKDLARLQDQLGALNDVAVAGALLRETLAEHSPDAGPAEEAERAWGAGLVTGWHRRDAADALDQARRTWARLNKRHPFWRPTRRR